MKARDEHIAPVVVRLPADLVAMLDAAAKAGFRSRSAEIRMRLEASLVNQSIDEHGVIVTRTAASGK